MVLLNLVLDPASNTVAMCGMGGGGLGGGPSSTCLMINQPMIRLLGKIGNPTLIANYTLDRIQWSRNQSLVGGPPL